MCGGNPRVIERELGLIDYNGFHEEWLDHPPLSWVAASYFKIRPRSKFRAPKPKRGKSGDLLALANAMGLDTGAALGRPGGAAPVPPGFEQQRGPSEVPAWVR